MLIRLAHTLWLGLGVIGAVWLLTSLASVVQGGDLDPPGAPGSTMQTLDDLLPSWHKSISGSDRFIDFSTDEGYVLDRETGLVWDAEPDGGTLSWTGALAECYNRNVAGAAGSTAGWRLPTFEELMTLAEPVAAAGPKLPAGHPFVGISAGERFWSATTAPGAANTAFTWNTDITTLASSSKASAHRAWCVRAPGGYDNVGG